MNKKLIDLIRKPWAAAVLALVACLMHYSTSSAVYETAALVRWQADSSETKLTEEHAEGIPEQVLALAMVALSTGMLWVWDRDPPREQLVTWRRTRLLFLLQVVVGPALALMSLASGGEAAAPTLNTMSAALWLAFATPYVHLLISLRSSVRWVARRESVAEFLTS